MSRALVLAGHGSHLDPNSSAPIHEHVARVRAAGGFEEVAAVFWKEEPHFSRMLDVVAAEDVTVVPVFMAEGYFTDRVIPREMRLAGPLTQRDGRTIRYTPPVGTHPRIADVVAERAWAAGAGHGDLVAVIGHGTPRHEGSAGTTVSVAAELRSRGLFRDVVPIFLDQEPSIGTLARTSPPVVAVPLFVADGWHAGVQLPGLAGQAMPGGLTYTPAAGTHPTVAEIALELAGAATCR